MSEDVRRMVGRNVKRLRIPAGLSQAELAERMGVDRAYVSGLELGQRNPTVVTLPKRGKAFRARVVVYADDFVILSRGSAAEALAWTNAVMTRIGLTLNEAKTSLKNARRERFDFLGYSFGPYYYKGNGQWYLSASVSKKSVRRLKAKVANLLVPGNLDPWLDVRDALNAFLFGWARYFSYGTHRSAFRGIDYYVYERVRDFLARRHKVKGRGTHQFSYDVVYGERGVLRLERLPWSLAPCASR